MADDEESHVWVRTDLIDDEYHLVIDWSDDHSASLTLEEGQQYGMNILKAVGLAEYDAAVARQMMQVLEASGVSDVKLLVAQVVTDLRERRDLTFQAGPLTLTPGVAEDDGVPVGFVRYDLNEDYGWTWRSEQSRDHAIGALEIVQLTSMDDKYFQTLVEDVSLPEQTARSIVDNLRAYREEGWGR